MNQPRRLGDKASPRRYRLGGQGLAWAMASQGILSAKVIKGLHRWPYLCEQGLSLVMVMLRQPTYLGDARHAKVISPG